MISTTQPLSSFEAKFLTTTATWPSGFRKAVTSPCCRGKGGNIWTSTWGDPCRPDRKLGHFEEGNMQMNDIYIYIYICYIHQSKRIQRWIHTFKHVGSSWTPFPGLAASNVKPRSFCCLMLSLHPKLPSYFRCGKLSNGFRFSLQSIPGAAAKQWLSTRPSISLRDQQTDLTWRVVQLIQNTTSWKRTVSTFSFSDHHWVFRVFVLWPKNFLSFSQLIKQEM